VTLVVGPEGGLSERKKIGLRHGARRWPWGRASCAPKRRLAAVAVLSAAWGGMPANWRRRSSARSK
jgi:hypothetical protein